jgi:hypothetical protein
MIELVDGRTLRCDLSGEQTHDRCVGICYLEDKGRLRRDGTPGGCLETALVSVAAVIAGAGPRARRRSLSAHA